MEIIEEQESMPPTVSVIIPFYENVTWLTEAVESVISQTYNATEIIIINDGSKENIDQFIQEYKNKIVYFYKKNGGPATARNFGIEQSRGDYIAFLDSDDIWLPEKLEKQISLMEKHNAIWSHTSYELFDTRKIENNRLKTISVNQFNGMIYPKMLLSNNLATPTIVIKGDFLRNNINLRFNNDMRYGQDQYLWINIAVENNILSINKNLVRVRMRGSNAAIRARVQLRARAIIWSIIKKDKEKYKLYKIPTVTILAYKLTFFGTSVLSFFEKFSKNTLVLEYISKIFYIVPWSLFKFSFYFFNKKVKIR